MSKAFTKESDQDGAEPLPDREISPFPNLVTTAGLMVIEKALAEVERELADARAAGDKDAQAHFSRDLRYWSQRRASAESMPPPPNTRSVHFGSRVTIAYADGRRQTWHIVGEDEADPKAGKLAYVSPLSRALLGKERSETVDLGRGEAIIVDIG